MRQLQDRVAVVTGAGGGIGRATALLLAERGCHLALADVDAAAAEETALEVRAAGRTASVHVVDVADETAMRTFAGEVEAEHGGCQILVNNAGVTSAGRFEDEPLDDLRWIIGINVWGMLYGCHFFLPQLRAADEAHIVNLSSMVALVGFPQTASYSLTKGAIKSFTEALRAELVGSSIGVTSIHPGAINTGISAAARGAQAARLVSMSNSRFAPLALRPPTAVARSIVRAIENNRARALVGPDAHIIDLASRLAPGRSGLIGRITNRLE